MDGRKETFISWVNFINMFINLYSPPKKKKFVLMCRTCLKMQTFGSFQANSTKNCSLLLIWPSLPVQVKRKSG